MNQIGQIIAQKLENIERGAQQTLRDIEAIRGVCMGYTAAMSDFNVQPPPQHAIRGVQTIASAPSAVEKTVAEVIEEVKKMIIELRIKGSVREHRNGLLKFTSTAFGCVYGRTKEEIEKQLKERIKHKRIATESRAPARKKKPTAVQSPLLSEYFSQEYLPFKTRQNLDERYLKDIERKFRFIVDKKFDKRLTEYTPKMIEDFLYSVPLTRKRQLLQGLLNNMFARALTLQLVTANPCASVERMQHKQEQGHAFSFDEQAAFFELLFASGLPYGQKCYFVFLYLTGARRNEGLALKREDVDFKNKVLHVRGTKTEGSDRRIPLTPMTERLLLSMAQPAHNGLYFPFSDNTVNAVFRKVWAKEKGHKPHDLRHTFGTVQICVEKVDAKTVSLWLGHSTIDTTMNIYTHPEQLDNGTFFRGDLTAEEKIAVYRKKYSDVLSSIDGFLTENSR